MHSCFALNVKRKNPIFIKLRKFLAMLTVTYWAALPNIIGKRALLHSIIIQLNHVALKSTTFANKCHCTTPYGFYQELGK